MSSVLVASCLFVLQQLQVSPAPTEVGREVVVTARDAAGAAAVASVEVVLPDGQRRALGATDAGGVLRFTPRAPGLHAFAASLDGVRCVAPVSVAAARSRWLLGLASVPLGLALLYAQLRRRRP